MTTGDVCSTAALSGAFWGLIAGAVIPWAIAHLLWWWKYK